MNFYYITTYLNYKNCLTIFKLNNKGNIVNTIKLMDKSYIELKDFSIDKFGFFLLLIRDNEDKIKLIKIDFKEKILFSKILSKDHSLLKIDNFNNYILVGVLYNTKALILKLSDKGIILSKKIFDFFKKDVEYIYVGNFKIDKYNNFLFIIKTSNNKFFTLKLNSKFKIIFLK